MLAPMGLVALVGVIAIIVAHMRRQVPPSVTLPSLRFWTAAPVQPADRRRLRRPPLTWPLALQVVAAALLALALARPALPSLPGLATERTEPQHTIVLLDGSTSMLAVPAEGAGTKWDEARAERRRASRRVAER